MMAKDIGSPMCFVPFTNLDAFINIFVVLSSGRILPSLLTISMLQCDEHVVNWEDLVICTLHFISFEEDAR
jgi:hypothetical protein